MYLHKNYGCYVISSYPPTAEDDDFEDEFDIYPPQSTNTVSPMQYLHKNYVIRPTSLLQENTAPITPRPYIGLANPLTIPTPVCSLLDEALPLDFSANILKPIIVHGDAPTAKLIDVEDLCVPSTCHHTNTTSLLDEQSPLDVTPTLIPCRTQLDKYRDLRCKLEDTPIQSPKADELQQNTETRTVPSPVRLEASIICDTQATQFHSTDKEHKISPRDVITLIRIYTHTFIYMCTCILEHLRATSLFQHYDTSEDHISETPLCKVRVTTQLKYVHKSLKETTHTNPHVPQQVLTWSLLPPDKHLCHIRESTVGQHHFTHWKEPNTSATLINTKDLHTVHTLKPPARFLD